MKKATAVIVLGSWIAAVIGCGGSEPSGSGNVAASLSGAATEQSITSAAAKRTGVKLTSDSAPCEVLDDALLRSEFDIPQEAEIKRNPSTFPHPHCSASWPKPNADEIEREGEIRMQEWTAQQLRGERVPRPVIMSRERVTLTIFKPRSEVPDSAAARGTFESAMNTLSNHLEPSNADLTTAARGVLTPVSGVGDQAMWAPSLRQLSVLAGKEIFHVEVSTGEGLDEDLARAKSLARKLATGS